MRTRIAAGVVALFLVTVLMAPVLAAPLLQDEVELVLPVALTVMVDDDASITLSLPLTVQVSLEEGVVSVSVPSTVIDEESISIKAEALEYSQTLKVSGPITSELPTVTADVTPPPTSTPAPSPTPIPQAAANANANLRAGPGTNFPIAGSVAAGDALDVVGSNEDGSWLALEDGTWIAAFLVNHVPASVPTVTPSPSPTATNTPRPTATVDLNALGVYVTDVLEWTLAVADSLSSIGELFTNPRLFSEEWQRKVAVDLAMLQLAHDKVAELVPPPGAEKLHEMVVDMLLSCKVGSQYTATGLENFSVEDLELASMYLEACGAKASTVTDEMLRLAGQGN